MRITFLSAASALAAASGKDTMVSSQMTRATDFGRRLACICFAPCRASFFLACWQDYARFTNACQDGDAVEHLTGGELNPSTADAGATSMNELMRIGQLSHGQPRGRGPRTGVQPCNRFEERDGDPTAFNVG